MSSSLDRTLTELIRLLAEPGLISPTASDPFFYFVHDPSELLELRRLLPAWEGRLREAGREPIEISLTKLLWKAVDRSGRWGPWLEGESAATRREANSALREVVTAATGVVADLMNEIQEVRPRSVLLLTGAAALHPFMRVRAIENAVTNKVRTPTVVFYPGRRSGQSGLRFLNLYEVDSSYRAVVVGGEE